MLIFGHADIVSQKFIIVDAIEDINKTTPNDIVLLKELKKPFTIAKHLQSNSICYGVMVNNITDAIFANTLEAQYAICNFEIAKTVQSIATEYLWDMKIISIIDSDNMLESVANASIDGVIYKNYLKD